MLVLPEDTAESIVSADVESRDQGLVADRIGEQTARGRHLSSSLFTPVPLPHPRGNREVRG
jgi:hypothetical protein